MGMNLFRREKVSNPAPAANRPSQNQSDSLLDQLEVFKAELHHLLENHRGEYVLMHDAKMIDFFKSYKEAMKAGYSRYGTDEPFLVQTVEDEEAISCFMRCDFECVT